MLNCVFSARRYARARAGEGRSVHNELLRFPDQKFSVICLCNLTTSNPERLAYQVADIYLKGNFHDARRGRRFLQGSDKVTRYCG